MKLIPKPEGFELRDKRSDKSCSGADWQVGDALYDAQQEINKADCNAVMVLWTQVEADGSTSTRYRYAGMPGSGERLFLNGLGKFMGWKP
jgi:hypothetical protein